MRHPLRALSVLAALALALAACGKRGDPLPPFPRTPQPVSGFTVGQRGDLLEATGVAPRTTTAGQPLQVFEVELMRTESSTGDIEKTAEKHRLRVAPGETFHHTWPLPPAGTSLRFAVRAINRGQRSVFAAPVALTVQAIPPAPTALKAGLEAGGVVLEWAGGPARVYRKAKGGKFEAPLAPTPTAAAGYRDTAIAGNDSWCYVVRAVTATDPLVESLPSAEACVNVLDVFAPAAPTGVAALAAGGVVDVSWSPSTEADLASYRVYRADGGAPQKLGDVPASETRFRDDKVTVGGSYTYTVTAVDKDGNESPPSGPARARLL